MLYPAEFFKYLRAVKGPGMTAPLYPNGLTQSHVDSFNLLIEEAERRKVPLTRFAYVLATIYHETATTMLPVMETRQAYETKNPTVDQAIARLENAWTKGSLPWVKTPYWRKDASGKSWLGRGLVQLTHRANYEKMQALTGAALLLNPDLAMNMPIAVKIIFEGMAAGSFTGMDLDDAINLSDDSDAIDREEYKKARRIINGTDKADLIANEALAFEYALKAGRYGEGAPPAPLPTPEPVPEPPPAPLPSPDPVAPIPAPLPPIPVPETIPDPRKSIMEAFAALFAAIFRRS